MPTNGKDCLQLSIKVDKFKQRDTIIGIFRVFYSKSRLFEIKKKNKLDLLLPTVSTEFTINFRSTVEAEL